MRRPTGYTLAFVGLALAALIAVLILRQKAPPEAARLLPESDAIVYVNVKPLRAATHFDRTPVERSAEFQQFVDGTGIVPERDLDEAAFALHRMADPHGPNGPVAFTEVFTGRFDGARLGKYLFSLAGSTGGGVENYANHLIYTIPVEGRRVRVVQLAYDTIAASNMPTTEQIHGMIDRQGAAASPFAGSSLLAARFPEVPVLSTAWAVGRIGLPFAGEGAGAGQISLFGLELPFAADTDFVASVRFTSALHLRVVEIAPSEAEAKRSLEQLTTMLGFVRTLARSQPQGGTGTTLATVLDGVTLTQQKDRAILTTTIPLASVQGLFKP